MKERAGGEEQWGRGGGQHNGRRIQISGEALSDHPDFTEFLHLRFSEIQLCVCSVAHGDSIGRRLGEGALVPGGNLGKGVEGKPEQTTELGELVTYVSCPQVPLSGATTTFSVFPPTSCPTAFIFIKIGG